MKLIKLSDTLGYQVGKILAKFGKNLRKDYKGFLTYEFTQEELDLVKEINIENPSVDSCQNIEFLHNLEILKISTLGNTAYKNNASSISDKDIKRISKLLKLKTLIIDNQSKITYIDIENLLELENLNITRNSSLENIFGLEKPIHIREFIEYGNKNLYKIESVDKMITNNNLEYTELDLLHYDEIISCLPKIQHNGSIYFSEKVTMESEVSYHYSKLLDFHLKCKKIAEEAMKLSPFAYRIMYVEHYLAKNITYDYEALNSEERAHYNKDGKREGYKFGTNSAYNGIMFGSAVCEGYTRSMQYILKLMGIQTENVDCLGVLGKDKYGHHSIIRVYLDNNYYYCDPCWDSNLYHAGKMSFDYCLLTKEEIEKDHILSYEEKNINKNNYNIINRNIIYQVMNSIEEQEKENHRNVK